MTQTKRKLRKEILSFILVLSMVVSGLPLTTFAETSEDNLCEHHTEHTPECGYVEAVEGQPCTHEHTDDCYSIIKCIHEHDEECGENGENCTHVCSEESGCITVKLNCPHNHDESCGYTESREGTPCGHVHDEECGCIEAVEEVLCDCTDTDENGEIIHTDGCGYVEAVEGSPCTHIHDENCGYIEGVEGTPCTHVCSIEGGCYELVCSHAVEGQHDDTCGYVEAVEGSPCEYECEEDHGEEETTESTETTAPAYTTDDVKAMIDALPSVAEMESMSSDELDAVYVQAQEAYDAFETLTDEEQIALVDDLVKLRDVLDFMTTQIQPFGTKFYYYGNFTIRDTSSYTQKVYNISTALNDSRLTLKFDVDYKGATHTSTVTKTITYTRNNYSCDEEISEEWTDAVNFAGYNVQFGISKSAGHYAAGWTSTGSTQHTGICEICGQTVTENHTGNATCSVSDSCSKCGKTYINSDNHKLLDNGICGCGKTYQEATLNNGVYEISNLGQLMWFAQQINGGQITAHQAKLTADITIDNSVVWTAIALPDDNGSLFDGCGHTITFANTQEGSTFGLFASYNYSTIQNLYLAGNITCNSAGYVGVLVNSAYSTTIQNVISTCTVNNSGKGATGGLAGYFGGGTANIKNSAVYADVSCGGYAGGLIGNIWNGNQPVQSVTNCAYMGNVTGGAAAGALVGYNGNNSGKNSPFTNVYYYEKNGLGYLGKTNGGTITATRLESKTTEQFKSGEVAYLLNNGVTDGTQAWYQICQSDNYPNFSGKTVYKGYVCGSGNSDPVYRNSMDGILTVASPEHKYNDSGICENCGQTKSATWDETENVYKIYNIGQLRWFADYVNAGNTNINGKLMADIDASSLTSLAIGVSGKAYSGTFDGNGHTLTIGLNSTAQYAAPFQYVNGATIKNLIVKGSITTSQKFAASIVGQSTGTTTIENCLSYVTINSSVSDDGTHGGLVANVQSGTTTINNCGFVGSINGSNTNSCGGLVGWSNGTTKINNSFVAATFTASTSGSYTFSRGNNVTLENCYYLNAFGSTRSGATQITADQLTSGELTWLLNGSKNDGTWKQTIGTDDYPNFSGGAVYKITPCEIGYTNNEAEKAKEHDGFNEQGFCKDCNSYQPAVWNNENNVYEISNVGQLLWFAGLVNGTLDGVAQNQSANAILKNDLDMSGITGYVPIGGTTGLYYKTEGDDKGYQGTFDGNGHIIKNLSVKGSDTNERTYGVFGTLSGTVKHLGVENFTFTLGSQDCRAGGIAGQVLSSGSITDCYVANSTITATGKVAGGIAGCNYAGTIQSCYTYYVTITGTRTGGIVGDNRGDNSTSDRLGTVSNCYTDASSIEGQAGTVEGSSYDVSATVFASGKIAYLLNGSTSDGSLVWKQTIGSDAAPNFSGLTVYYDADNEPNYYNERPISVQITWTEMEFTYTDGEWNPETHKFENAGWIAADGAGVITAKNTGNVTVDVSFKYTQTISGISGSFTKDSMILNQNESDTTKFGLNGEPGTDMNCSELGMITVTVKKHENE